MRVVHLSDIHYHPNQKNFTRYCLDPLIKDLQKYSIEEPVELICFTGDLIDKGGYDSKKSVDILEAFDDFEQTFVEPLLKALKLEKHQFVFIPGNHDIDRKSINEYSHDGMLGKMTDRNKIDTAMRNVETLDLNRIEHYKTFENLYFSDSNSYYQNPFGYAFIHEKNGEKIGIGGINSAWLCKDDNDSGKLIVGREQLDFIQDTFKDEKLDLSIALMHHSYEALHPEEVDFVRDTIIRDYDLLLVGHTHKTSTYSLSTSIGNGCVLSTAPANWVSNNFQVQAKYQNGYNIIDVFENQEKEKSVKVHFRRYNYEKNQFVSNTDAGEGDSGTSKFSFRSNEAKQLYFDQTETINYVKDHFTEEINQNLISYNTDTIAPKDLKSLFVLPKIVKQNYEPSTDRSGNEVTKKEEVMKLEDLCLSDRNLVLFGPQETGKTTILYRIASEYIEQIALYKKIPIYVDLKGLTKGDIKKKMIRFIGKSISKFEKTLQSQKVVLLLDNLRFNQAQEDIIFQEISELISSYPNLLIIASAETMNDQEKPLEFVNHKLSKDFDSANIQYFKTYEIQALMNNWFNNGGVSIENEKLEQLIKNFRHLNIPSTPLAVSMFLWIYEKQKDFRPVNNAAMVQNFLEKSFEKHTKAQVLSEEFDYDNKEHLLAQIALKMYNKNNANYRMEALELKTYIKSLYERKKMEVKIAGTIPFHDWIIEEFINKGVLISEMEEGIKYYKFKLNCFFQYCLARNMTFNKEFKTLVMDRNSYLTFSDEIDYYTGLNRYQDDILEIVVKRMEEFFSEHLTIPDSLFSGNTEPLPFDLLYSLQDPQNRVATVEYLEEKDLDNILESNKQNEEDAVNANDNLLALGNHNDQSSIIPNKVLQSKLTLDEILQQSWILAAKVLKNSEESENGQLKDRAFRSIMLCSLITATLVKNDIEQILKDEKNTLMKTDPDMYAFFSFYTRFSLYVHELHLFSVVGTSKLLPVIRDYLELNIDNDNVSNVEKYIAMFLYMDAKAPNYQEKLNRILYKYNSSSVNDFAFMKISMLHSITKNKSEEKYYREKLNQLIKRSKKGNVLNKNSAINTFYTKNEKVKILENLKEINGTKK